MKIQSFLSIAIAICGALTTSGATAADVFRLETQNIAPNVYVFIEPDRHGIVSGNVTLVVGEQSALVFDTTHRVSSARQIIAGIKALTAKPVRFVVNSHWHEDHWTGNGEFSAAFPDARFHAHPFTADIIARRKESFRGQHCKDELRAELPPLQKQLLTGMRDDGTKLSEAAIAFRRQLVGELESQIDECDAMRYRGIDVTFVSDISLDLGARIVQLKYLGRGNTAGDVIAYLPDERILLTGDLVVAPFPFATQSYIREWADVLDRLKAMHASIIVPGHGPVMRDYGYVEDLAELMRSISSQVHSAYKSGMTAKDVRSHIDIQSIRSRFVGDDPFIVANFDHMILDLAVERAIQEEQGELKPEG